jgi:membrane protein
MWKTAWSLIRDTYNDWSENNATRLAAALAYYSILSLAPLLVVAVTVAGFVFGDDAARGQISAELEKFFGPQASKGIETVLTHAREPEAGLIGSTVGVAVLLFGASGVFAELQSALDTIWRVEPKPGRGVWGILKDRFFSFTMVLGVAFLLLVSLVLSAALSAVGNFFSELLPGGELIWQATNFVVSLATITLLFALIFKVIPDVKIGWRDVWPGALFTAVLFTIGKFALGFYLGRASVASAYGAAGSLIVFVIWVYYAAQILFMGAEFTQIYTLHRGKSVPPTENAVPKTGDSGPSLSKPRSAAPQSRPQLSPK